MNILLTVLSFIVGALCMYDSYEILSGKRKVKHTDLLLGMVACMLSVKHYAIFGVLGILISLILIFHNSLNDKIVKFTGILSNVLVLISLLLI